MSSIFFKIIINDFYLSIKKSELHNFADNNPIACGRHYKRRNRKLEAERKQLYIGSKTIKCRIINPDKFQADIVKKNNKISDGYFLNIGEAKCEKSVTDFIRDQN